MATSALEKNQAARRARVLDAARSLASAGGFDAVQMRDVASEADVAIGTLYRYFPSKEFLLVSIMLEQVEGLLELVSAKPPRLRTAARRVMTVMEAAQGALPSTDLLSAMVKALASTQPEVADLVREVTEKMTAIILVAAVGTEPPSSIDEKAARVVELTWFSSLIGWIGGIEERTKVLEDLELATVLAFGTEQERQAFGECSPAGAPKKDG